MPRECSSPKETAPNNSPTHSEQEIADIEQQIDAIESQAIAAIPSLLPWRFGCPRGPRRGLRKAGSARLAELGASDREIMAITGHQTGKEVDRYTKGARQKKLAASAMEKWEQGRND